MKNILDIMYEYSKNSKLLDYDAINQIVKSYKKEYNINILKKLNIINKHEMLFGRFSYATYFDDEMNVYYRRLLFGIKNEEYKSEYEEEDNLSIFEHFYRVNLFILKIICHELEHGIQEQKSKEEPKTLEDKLVKLECYYLDHMGEWALNKNKYNEETDEYDANIFEAIKFHLAEFYDNKLYRANYDISLLERLADIDSMTKIINMTKEIEKETPTIYPLMNKLLLERKIRDYDESFLSPTTEFFRNITGKRQFYFHDYIDMKLDDRLRLGLPINRIEHLEINKLLKK